MVPLSEQALNGRAVEARDHNAHVTHVRQCVTAKAFSSNWDPITVCEALAGQSDAGSSAAPPVGAYPQGQPAADGHFYFLGHLSTVCLNGSVRTALERTEPPVRTSRHPAHQRHKSADPLLEDPKERQALTGSLNRTGSRVRARPTARAG
ncbi:hypothetical protein GCM10023317_09700 [Actinopolymorpha pittospori]